MSMPMKDSGVDWLGQVPAHWTMKRLRHVVQFNPKPNWKALERQQSNYSFLPMEAIGETGEIDKSRTRSLAEVRGGYSYFSDGDVIYAKVTPCFENGKGAVLQALIGGHGFGTTELTVMRPNGIDRSYLYALTYAFCFRSPAASEMQGTGGLKRVPEDYARNYRCAIPPIEEQIAICSYLDRATTRIDALVAKKTRFIELLREKRQALITHAVTKGLDPNVPMKDSGVEWFGKVPMHWTTYRLAMLFREVSRTGRQDLPVLSISIHDGISDDELDEEERSRKVTLIEDRSKYKKVMPGDLAYNMMRAWQGAFGAVAVMGQVSPAYVVAEPKVQISTVFIEFLLRTPMAIEEMRRFSRGIADFRSRLYWEHFRDVRVCLPPVDEQIQIVSSVGAKTSRIDTLIAKTERSIELLREHRSALITAAVTGKIDVGEAHA